MSLKNQIIADTAIYLNTDEFAEKITYNGTEITAVFELGETNTRGNQFSSDGQSDIASVWVSETDVPSPVNDDEVINKGKTWRVSRILEDGGGMYRLELTGNESAFLRRR